MQYSKKGARFRPWALRQQTHESSVALDERRNSAYFDWQLHEMLQDWWSRLPPINVLDKQVLDLGCGHGSLVVDLVNKGAAGVVGVDLDHERIEFARRYVARAFPDYRERCTFVERDVAELQGSFDVIVSKDSFEHIDDLEATVGQIHRLLKPGGILVAGFAPLYFSPFGDHGRYLGYRLLPWLPVVFSEKTLLRIAKAVTGKDYRSTSEFGLNKMTPAQFRELFDQERWRIESIKYNEGNKVLLSPMRMARRITSLEQYFTVSIYAVIQKL